jgi:hypothetical protein
LIAEAIPQVQIPAVPAPTTLKLTRFEDVRAQEAEVFDTTFAEFAKGICAPKRTYPSKGDCPLLKLATFGDVKTDKDCLRHDANVRTVTGIEGDHDAGTMKLEEAALLLELAGLQAVLYTSASNTKEHPRWRVLAFFSRERTPQERTKFAARLNGVLKGELAPESFSLSQSFYFGRVEGAEYEAARIDGDNIDTRVDLDAGAIGPKTNGHLVATPDDFSRTIALRNVNEETMADLRDAVLNGLSQKWADDRALWVRVAHAIASLKVTPYAEQALELWHEFSRRGGNKYREAETESKWHDEFDPDTITYRSIFTWAEADGWKNPRKGAARLENEYERTARIERERERERSARIGREGDHKMPTQRIMTGTEMLEELVFLADGARVSFVQEPRFVLSLADFRMFTAGSIESLELSDGRKVKKHRLNLWVEHPERKTVKTQTFAPGRPAVCASPRNEQAQNLWQPKVRKVPGNWQELAQPFFDHVDYLMPVEEERERFLNWLAHIEQVPGVLPSTHYLLVTQQTGIGRNWMACALARVFAGHTALGFDLGSSIKSGFNDELSQTLLAVVDELHEGGPGGMSKPLAEKLKSMLVEPTRVINPKFGRKHIEFNACRFLMFSNHEAALPLADNDRRVVVIQNPTERKPADYYQSLYALLEQEDFGDAIAEAFVRRDISGFNPGEIAPMNAAKARTIRAGRTELEQAVRDIAAEWPSDCITSTRLSHEVAAALGTMSKTQGAGRDAGLVKYGYRVKVAGIAHHIWILRNVPQWANVSGADIAAEVLRGEQGTNKDAPLPGKTANEAFAKCE